MKVIQLGNLILRRRAESLGSVDMCSKKTRTLVRRMLATIKAQQAVGLAAPQVGAPVRIIIIASRPTAAYPDAPKVEPIVMMNPFIIARSHSENEGWEGCASIPGIRGRVLRNDFMKVRFFNAAGRPDETELEGFLARIFQHEFDHLEATVFTDRAIPASFMTEREYQKMMKSEPKRKK